MKYILTQLCLLTAIFSIADPGFCQDVNRLKLKNYHPVSIYKTAQVKIEKAKYSVVGFHSHNYPKSNAEVDAWVKAMDETSIAKTMILSYTTGTGFDSVVDRYTGYKDRFDIWCGFNYTGYDKPGWQQHAVAELERCYKKGAIGVGELGDKGLGELYSKPVPGYGFLRLIHRDVICCKKNFQKDEMDCTSIADYRVATGKNFKRPEYSD